MQTTNELIQSVKTSCDNDTIMYCFNDSDVAQAYDRKMIHTLWETPEEDMVYKYEFITDPETGETRVIEHASNSYIGSVSSEDGKYVPGADEYTYYARVILPRIVNEPCLNVYYKNNNGVWVDYRKCLATYPNLSILVSSINYQEYVKADINNLPKCEYMDGDKYIHYIDEHDGLDSDLAINSIEVDTNDQSVVSYRPYSIEEPSLPFTASHMMQDLKVTIPETLTAKNFLIWLNGAFVPQTQDATYKNSFYLENAMTMINTRVVNQKLGSKPLASVTGNATVNLDEDNDEYRYDVKMRLFGWQGVKISNWYKPLSTARTPIIHNYSSVYIVKTITFNAEINENAHFIMENGIVLDRNEYTIDPNDKRKVTLKNVERNAYNLLSELIRDFNYDNLNGTSYYMNVKPLNLITDLLTQKTYSLVNFESEDEDKELYMKRSTACAVNFPYAGEVTFPKVNIGDLVLINGAFNRYEWIHQNTILYPKFRYSYTEEEATMTEKQVERIYFILKDK